MKREIKFRAWDIEAKRMIYDVAVNALENSLNKQFTCDADEYNWMEFTGLKDMNNKEIYEGDIIKTYWPKTSRNSICKVEFLNGGFMGMKEIPINNEITINEFKNDPSWLDRKFHLTQKRCENYCEIIGNIYETPELLEA